MPGVKSTASFEAVKFALRSSDIFVIASLLAAFGALLALSGMAWVFALAAAVIIYFISAMLGGCRRGAWAISLAFLLFFLLAQNRLAGLIAPADDLSQLRANVVSFIGRVESCKDKETGKGHSVTLVVVPEKLLLPWAKPLAGRVLVHVGPFEKENETIPVWGGRYIFSGRLITPRAKVFSFEFDEKRWLSLQNIFCQVSCTASGVQSYSADGKRLDKQSFARPLIAGIEDFAGRLVAGAVSLREGIVARHISCLGVERGKLLTSMVLGDRAVSLDDGLKITFNRVGLSHLLAASGLNLTIIVGACFFVFSRLRKGRQGGQGGLVQAVGALLCVLFFVSLAGASPSVTRATIMCLLLLWSSLLLRRLARGTALAGALWLALTFDPLSILDVGLELSYGATFGIIYFYPMFTEALPAFFARKPWHWLSAICSVVVAAQLAVLPVQIYYFQKVSTLVLPANILAEPLVAPITVMGFVSSFVSALALALAPLAASDVGAFVHLSLIEQLFHQASALIDFFSGFLIDLLLLLARSLGSLPFSYLYLAPPQAVSIVSYYLFLFVSFLIGINRPACGALLALICGVLLTGQSFLFSPCLEVLVTKQKVLIGRPLDPVLMLDIESPCRLQSSPGERAAQGYLPAYHRDFVLSYLRSLNGRACTASTLGAGSICRLAGKAGGGIVTDLGDSKHKLANSGCPIASIDIEEGRPRVGSSFPAAAIYMEQAQEVRFYKFRLWGLLWPLGR
jgi:ComEC/Rec2-related protein